MKKFLTGFVAAGLLVGALSLSHALTQFAVLNPVPSPPGPQTPYQFFNATQTFDSNVDVNAGKAGNQMDVTFAFLQPVPVIGTNTVEAELTITAIATTPMGVTNQDLEAFVFEVTAKNAGDVFGGGVLLRTIVPAPADFPAGTLADLFSVGNTAFLQSEFGLGLIMDSDYILIDPDENQTATWSFSLIDPFGPFAPGPNMFLRDTKLGGNANFSATVFNRVPEPGSVAMLIGFGVGGSLALIRRRRTR
jgi:hypothetical protein